MSPKLLSNRESNTRRDFLRISLGVGAAALIAAKTSPTIAAPEQKTRLLSCHIAGTSYRNLENIESQSVIGDNFLLKREPANRFDARAVAVYNCAGIHLGYIPRRKNEILANLLDGDKKLSARLVAKERINSWLKLDIEVFLHE